MRHAPCREPFILNFDEAAGQIPIGLVPPSSLMSEHLNVDSAFIQSLQSRGSENQTTVELIRYVTCEVRVFDEVQFFRRNEVAVHVDHFDSAAPQLYLAARRGRHRRGLYRNKTGGQRHSECRAVPDEAAAVHRVKM